jgi:hypothetical protein
MKLNRFLWMLGICLSLLLCITSCTGGETPSESDTLPPDQVTDASTGDAPQEGTETDTEGDTQEDTEAETDKVYADIGDGSFTLLQDTYYAVVGGHSSPRASSASTNPIPSPSPPRGRRGRDPGERGRHRYRLPHQAGERFVRIVALKLTGGYEPNLGGHLMQISEIEVYWN